MKGDLSGLLEPGRRRRARRQARRATSASRSSRRASRSSSSRSAASARASRSARPCRTSARSCSRRSSARTRRRSRASALVFHYADAKALPLLDLADLRALLTFLDSEEGKAELEGIGGLSKQTVGVLLRNLVEPRRPAAATSSSASRSSTSPTSCARRPTAAAIISCVELPAVQDKPKLFSTVLMWMLAELFETLPEVGDVDKPKLVFFFDEAHLLFNDASKAFVESVDADRAAHPLQGRRRLLRHAVAEGHPGGRARPARQPRPARAARVHARRPEGAQRGGRRRTRRASSTTSSSCCSSSASARRS